MAKQQAKNDDPSGLPPLSYAFDADAPAGSALSYEQLQSRRKIAEELAGRQLGYPKNIGEGIYAGAKGLTDAYGERQVADADAKFRAAARREAADAATRPLPGDPVSGAPPPPMLPPRPSPAPPPLPQMSDAAPAGEPPAPLAFAEGAPPAPPVPDGLPPGGQPLPGPAGMAPPPPDQVMAGRTALAQALANNPRGVNASNPGTLPPMVPMPATAAAPVPAPGGGAQPPFGGGGTTARSDPGNPAIFSPIKPAVDQVTYAGLPKPPGPVPVGREERNAMARLMADPTDPYNVARWKPVVDAWAAERARQGGLAKELYDKQLTDVIGSQKERRELQAGEDERRLKLQKAQTEVPFQPLPGANAAQEDPGLGTPNSQQRKGYPDLGPIPPNVIPAQHIAARQKEMVEDVKAVQKADQTVPETLQLLHDLKTHKGKDAATGFFGAAAQGIRGSNARDFAELIERAQGGAFLQAYSLLRGSGQISNAEGAKATAAIAQLSTAQSKEALDKALDDLEHVVRRGYEVAQRKVNQPVTAYRDIGDKTSFAPDVGQMSPGRTKRYIGGNPRDPSNWVKTGD